MLFLAYMDWLVNNNHGKIQVEHIIPLWQEHRFFSTNLQTEDSYPYTATDGSCRPASNGDFPYGRWWCSQKYTFQPLQMILVQTDFWTFSVTGQYNLWNTNEGDMKELVYINPVTTSIQVDIDIAILLRLK